MMQSYGHTTPTRPTNRPVYSTNVPALPAPPTQRRGQRRPRDDDDDDDPRDARAREEQDIEPPDPNLSSRPPAASINELTDPETAHVFIMHYFGTSWYPYLQEVHEAYTPVALPDGSRDERYPRPPLVVKESKTGLVINSDMSLPQLFIKISMEARRNWYHQRDVFKPFAPTGDGFLVIKRLYNLGTKVATNIIPSVLDVQSLYNKALRWGYVFKYDFDGFNMSHGRDTYPQLDSSFEFTAIGWLRMNPTENLNGCLLAYFTPWECEGAIQSPNPYSAYNTVPKIRSNLEIKVVIKGRASHCPLRNNLLALYKDYMAHEHVFNMQHLLPLSYRDYHPSRSMHEPKGGVFMPVVMTRCKLKQDVRNLDHPPVMWLSTSQSYGSQVYVYAHSRDREAFQREPLVTQVRPAFSPAPRERRMGAAPPGVHPYARRPVEF